MAHKHSRSMSCRCYWKMCRSFAKLTRSDWPALRLNSREGLHKPLLGQEMDQHQTDGPGVDSTRQARRRRSQTRPSLQRFRITCSLHIDLRRVQIDLTQIVGGELNCNCVDVLLQAMQFRCAGDGNNPGLLGQQPCKRNLSRRRVPPFCDLAQQINQGLVGLASLRCKAWNDIAEIRLVEGCVLVDLSCEEALPQRTEWNEADAQFLTR